MFLSPSEKGSTQMGKDLLPMFCFSSKPLFRRDLGVQESKQKVTEIVSLVKMAEKIYFVYPVPLMHILMTLNFRIPYLLTILVRIRKKKCLSIR